MHHKTAAELAAGLAKIQQAPQKQGTLDLIVRRPAEDAREVLAQGELDLAVGLLGDRWEAGTDENGVPNAELDRQLNVMNTRVIDLVAGDRACWELAGDQLFVDLDLSANNLPVGTRLGIGNGAVIEVTPPTHAGCKKFSARFGVEALQFVNGPAHRALRLRGLCAKVIVPGLISPGDPVTKLP